MNLYRRLVAEWLGTAFLLAIIVGSGIMAERMAPRDTGEALLANALATGCGLAALILTFGEISGAHFNPVVSLAAAIRHELTGREATLYISVQIIGAFCGVAASHAMFGEPTFFASHHVRTGPSQWWSEFLATFGLLGVVMGCSQSHPKAVPFAVACYIVAAYWFTSSTSFANPAVTLARAASDTFAGIRPQDTLAFIAAQFAGAVTATIIFAWLLSEKKSSVLSNEEGQLAITRKLPDITE
jgi:glycerol uptake facilitator-like aquaporin